MKQYTVGVDVGGTGIKLGLVNRSGAIIARSILKTKQFHRSKSRLINAIIEEIKNLIRSKKRSLKQVAGVGIGLPGLIESEKGIVKYLPNISGWKNVQLKKIMQEKLRVPIRLENDVNLITLGEWRHGAGKGCKSLICLTLGTGVGAD